MKVRCIKNYEPGFFGFDERKNFEIGQVYISYSLHNSIYIFAKEKWKHLYNSDFQQMFVPCFD